jgi:hypothetical protein
MRIEARDVLIGGVADGDIVDGGYAEGKNESASAELVAIVFMGLLALAAETTGFMLLLFPELAALCHDVMVRPHGKWGSQPFRLVLTPTLTAVVGIFVARHLAFGITLIVALSLLIIQLLKSTIAAAISAGVLPMALNERSWRYPLAIFVDCTVLVLIFLAWRHYAAPTSPSDQSKPRSSKTIDSLESMSHDRFCIPALMFFVVALGIAAGASGLRFLIFPPPHRHGNLWLSYRIIDRCGWRLEIVRTGAREEDSRSSDAPDLSENQFLFPQWAGIWPDLLKPRDHPKTANSTRPPSRWSII